MHQSVFAEDLCAVVWSDGKWEICKYVNMYIN